MATAASPLLLPPETRLREDAAAAAAAASVRPIRLTAHGLPCIMEEGGAR